jgi:hypothetical protein
VVDGWNRTHYRKGDTVIMNNIGGARDVDRKAVTYRGWGYSIVAKA